MGEAADMILEGYFCQACGELLLEEDGDPCGYPTFCDSCSEDE